MNSAVLIAITAVTLVILVLVVGGILFGARLRRRMFGGWQTTAATLQLTYDDSDMFPLISGTLDGIAVTAEIHNQTVTDAAGKPRVRPWTRVRARLPIQAQITVRHRGQRLTTSADNPPRPTGDPAFDARYELYAPTDADLDNLLPTAVRGALLAANLRIHIWQDSAVWMKARVVGDADDLTQVLEACTAVASAYRRA